MTEETIRALVEQLRADANRALTCLYIAVESDVADDVRHKVLALVDAQAQALTEAEARATTAEARDTPPIKILDELHHVLTVHGIASRAWEYEKLVTALIQWAAQACRQSRSMSAPTGDEPTDDEIRDQWRLVQGANAEINGPLLRFAHVLFQAGMAKAHERHSSDLRWVRAQRVVAEDKLAAAESQLRSLQDQQETLRRRHLALVAIMNALDIHMPPDGSALLHELRQIAGTVGYPWTADPAPSAPPRPEEWQTTCESSCNPFVAPCGARFCTSEEMEAHAVKCAAPPPVVPPTP
jgi:hypothetical protein